MYLNLTGILKSKIPVDKWLLFSFSVSVWVLFVIACLVSFQKYMIYGGSEDFDAMLSFFFNALSIIPFAGFIMMGLKLEPKLRTGKRVVDILLLILTGVVITILYALCINIILYSIGLSKAIPSAAFLKKYFTGTIQIHLSMYLFIQMLAHLVMDKKEQKAAQRTLIATRGKSKVICNLDTIEWMESYDHYIKLHTTNGLLLHKDTMNNMEKELPEGFLRVHRKYIVNASYIDSLETERGKLFLMVRGQKLSVSKSYAQQVKALF